MDEITSKHEEQKKGDKGPVLDHRFEKFEKARLKLQRLASQSEEALLLEEREHVELGRQWYIRLALRLLVLAAILTVIFTLCYFFIVPRFVVKLPLLVRDTAQAFRSYNRSISGTVSFDPNPAILTHPSFPQPFVHGVTFSTVVTATTNIEGLQGTVRIDADKGAVEETDIDIGYRVVRTGAPDMDSLFFFVNRWPQYLLFANPLANEVGTWYREPVASSGDDPFRSVSWFLERKNFEKRQSSMNVLWQHALSTGALQWKMTGVSYDGVRHTWLAHITYGIETERLPVFFDAVRADPLFSSDFRWIFERPLGPKTLKEMLQESMFLSGTVSVGIFDRLAYDISLSFALTDPIGTFGGTLTGSIINLPTTSKITAPAASIPADSLLAR